MNDYKILLVDDEEEFVATLSERLQLRGLDVAVVLNGEAALERLERLPEERPDVMVLDLRMPGVDGVEVLRRVKRAYPRIQVIVMTGHGSDDDRSTCLELGACDYHKKPIDIEHLLESLREAANKAVEFDANPSAL